MSAAVSHLLPEFYTWSFPGAPIQIQLNLEVVRRLRTQLEEFDAKASPASPCGLLLGDSPRPGITRILDFRQLPALDTSTIGAEGGSAHEKVVGFYRASPLCETTMPDADRGLAENLFTEFSSVFLLIATGKPGTGEGHFCFWDDRQLFDWPLMPFPFDEVELAVQEQRHWSRKARELAQSSHTGLAEVPPAEPLAAPDPVPASPVETAQSQTALAARRQSRMGTRPGWLLPALAAVAAASILSGAFLYTRGRSGVRPAEPPTARAETAANHPLGLVAEKRGRDLWITWNGKAETISKGEYGMLLVRGSESRDVPLTAEELHSGSVTLESPVDEVRLQLNVVSGERVTREFLTVLMKESAAVTAKALPAVSVSSEPRGDGELTEPARTRSHLKPFQVPEQAGTAGPSGGRAASSARIEEPPSVNPVAAGNPGIASLPNPAVVDWRPPAELPAQRVSQQELDRLNYEALPPVAIHQTLPVVPPEIRGVFWKATMVEVKVSVDVAGNVVKAEAVPKPGLHPLLRDAAVQAARRWKFKPAQFGGHAVPGNIVVQFNFGERK